ncbi:hypothetical protein [Halobacillus salinus]|uniref:hypothetical protein n=1 Tax=Halobacillus salinus TaxID=192814 RepID=UPI0009A57051|nr:hypothetical protein [Halobacillus salinus]
MRKFISILLAVTWILRLVSRKVLSPTLPNSTLNPGDLLFSPIGKRESKYIGHVGIVSTDQHIIHSIPSGLVKDTASLYYKKFRRVHLYQPIQQQTGPLAAEYAEFLFQRYPKAVYKVNTRLGEDSYVQYCTKIVWQSYYYGAGVNLGNLSENMRAVHPVLLKRKSQLTKRN